MFCSRPCGFKDEAVPTLQWKGKRGISFSFPFLRPKKIKREQWAGLNILSFGDFFFFFFTLIAPNSAYLQLSLLFCPLTMQEPIFARIILCLPLQHFLPLVVTYQKGGLRATKLPGSIAGLLMSAYECFWQDPNTFVPHRWLLWAIIP